MISSEQAEQLSSRKELIEAYLDKYLDDLKYPRSQALVGLMESIRYSLLRGGKRFRPTLSLALAEAFAVNPLRILPWACAVEMIHTYSLIHDDLPCMDNDDLRRGEPTNHKVYGEGQALLAGDALLTEAFALISDKYEQDPRIAVALIRLLTEAAGFRGMVGGQAIDLETQKRPKNEVSIHDLNLTHSLKTGALIRVAIEGAAIACGLPTPKVELSRKFGAQLGLAFQIADDILDFNPENPEKGNFATTLGLAETQGWLKEVSQEANQCLTDLGILKNSSALLWFMVEYNQTRTN